MLKRLVPVLILIGASAGAAYFYRERLRASQAPQSGPVWVRPQRRTLVSQVTATGTVRLKTGAEVRVGAQISGIVTRLNVNVGSHVERGDVVAVIDSRGLFARIADARTQIDVDRSALRKVERNLERIKQLAASGLVPRQQLEDLEEDLSNAQARIVKSESSLKVVESDLPYLEIRAPITGTVASVSTQEGETVAASFATPTFATVIADNALELIAMVDETDIGGIRRGQRVTFTAETFPGRNFSGTVDRIAPKATIVAGVVNYEVGVRLTGNSSALKPDMTANITIEKGIRHALMIPHGATQHEGDSDFVFTKAAGGPARRKLSIASREGAWDEVRGGLSPEDLVLEKPPSATPNK